MQCTHPYGLLQLLLIEVLYIVYNVLNLVDNVPVPSLTVDVPTSLLNAFQTTVEFNV